jgi:HEAT repeat protein
MFSWRIWRLSRRLRGARFVTRRIEAAHALGETRDPRALPPLLSALNDSDSAIVYAALSALGKLDDAKATPALTKLATGRVRSGVRIAAIQTLGKLRDPDAIETLVVLLSASDEQVAWEAAIAIQGFGALAVPLLAVAARDWKGAEDVVNLPIDVLGGIDDLAGIDALLSLLNDSKDRTRAEAAKALGKRKRSSSGSRRQTQRARRKVVEALVPLLSDQNRDVRLEAGRSLKALGWGNEGADHRVRLAVATQKWDEVVTLGEAAAEPLIQLLREGDRGEEWLRVIELLGQIGDARAEGPLLEVLQDANQYIREFTMTALARIGTDRATQHLLQEFRIQGTPNRYVLASLARDPSPQAIPLLQAVFRADGDLELRSLAARALEAMGWTPKNTEERIGLQVALGAWDEVVAEGSAAVDVLINEVRRGENSEVTHALVRIGNAAVIPLVNELEQSLQTDDLKSCTRVARVLGKIGDERALDPLVCASECLDVTEPLVQTGGERALPVLVRQLRTGDEQRRASVASIFGSIRRPESSDALFEAFQTEESERVRQIALESLTSLGDVRIADQVIPPLIEDLDVYRGADTEPNMGWRNGEHRSLSQEEIRERTARRCNAAERLGAFKDVRAVKALLEVHENDKDGSVLAAVRDALRALDALPTAPELEAVACSICRGRGEREVSGGYVNCTYCSGSGRVHMPKARRRELSNRCQKCGRAALHNGEFRRECDLKDLILDGSGNLLGPLEYASGIEDYQELRSRRGFRCADCSRTYCRDCASDPLAAHPRSECECPECGGSFERYEDLPRRPERELPKDGEDILSEPEIIRIDLQCADVQYLKELAFEITITAARTGSIVEGPYPVEELDPRPQKDPLRTQQRRVEIKRGTVATIEALNAMKIEGEMDIRITKI